MERPQGVQWAFRGEVAAARKAFQQMLAQAEMSGEVRAALIMHIQLCELELRCGHPGEAMRHLDELNLWIAHHDLGELMARLQVVLSAVSGQPADAARAAAVVLDHAGASEWDRIEVQRACGISALFEGDAERAVELLWPIWERTLREHVDDPGAFPVAGDLVEALVLAGKATSALDVLDRLRQSGSDQRHPWALTTTDRCAAMIQLNERFDQTAARSLEKAASDLADLGLDFDAARCWLALGRAQRRSKKTGEARRSLERAAAQFEQHGCTGWAELARAEQARISGRRPTSENKLTPSEERVVDLAASGLSNKEIARQLFVSVNTVEEHLSHAYAKLGVRSRSQLAGLAVQRAADQAP